MSGSEAQAVTLPASAVKAAKSSILLDLLPHALQTFRREPALAITLCYLLVAMAGIFYNYSFYQKFGIPILTLSQISDFLVAGLQQPMALLLVLSTFPLCWILDRFNAWKRERSGRRRDELMRSMPDSLWRTIRLRLVSSPPRWVTALFYVAIVIWYGWYFVFFYARHRAEAVRDGEAQEVTVWLSGNAEPLPAKAGHWLYLGAVSSYVFVYDRAEQRAVVLPVNNIARLEPLRKAGSAGATLAPIR